MPNLITDRGLWVAAPDQGLNVRRLMYQPLIWLGRLGDDAGRLISPLDPEDLKSLADSLVNRMRRNIQAGRDFL